MNLINKLKENLRKWLILEPRDNEQVRITKSISLINNQIKNNIWLRGQASEIEQLFKDLLEFDSTSFWGNVSTLEKIRKIHYGLPGLLVNTLSNIVLSDIANIDISDKNQEEIWELIDKDNDFKKILNKSLKNVLAMGDGAFKINYKTDISEYPIIEFYEALKVNYTYKYGKLHEIVFKTEISENKKKYVLLEVYGFGYINYELYDENGNQLELNELDETKNLNNVIFANENGEKLNIMLAQKMTIWESDLFEGRGKSIFDGKDQAFDMLDEVISQWVDALRKGRTKTYIPFELLPKDEKGNILMKSDFFNQFIQSGGPGLKSDSYNPKIETVNPEIRIEAYLQTYSTALDICLQGLISPSTLGIDIKKLDNNEAQREKEKTTLYTRNAIIEAITETIQNLIKITLQSYQLQLGKIIEVFDVSVTFGEYNNPSFEAVIETNSKAAPGKQIMSYKRIVEEIWGDKLTDEEKAEEVKALEEINNIGNVDMDIPNLMMEEEKEII